MSSRRRMGRRARCVLGYPERPEHHVYRHIFFYCLLFIIMSIVVLDISLDMFGTQKMSPKIHIKEYITPIAQKFEILKQSTTPIERYNSASNFIGDVIKTENNVTLKYILVWTSPQTVPFVYLGSGRKTFMERRCEFNNCYVTSHRNFLDYTQFDVIAFASTEIRYYDHRDLPPKRSASQKYVFASIESADNYPVCSARWNGFFNWTWTYKLDSDSRWGYIIVRDTNNSIIGPNKEMHWMKLEDMEPVSDTFKKSLRTKTKAVAWFVSNCYTKRQREDFVDDLSDELQNYNLTVDVYGKCGDLSCSRNTEKLCDKLIKKDYFFYLAFENSFSDDYVTEKILHALQYNTIPIVYGGANYTRFMPDGIYLDARQMGIFKLAEKIYELIHNIDKYAEYFKWQKYYSFHARNEDPETDDYCGFCALLNNEEKLKETTIYEDFQKWWDHPSSNFTYECLITN